MDAPPVFPAADLPLAVIRELRAANPWWEGRPLPLLPPVRRALVAQMARRLQQRLAPIVVVRGPRRVGKTTATLHLLSDLLTAGTPPRSILRVQFDELPSLASLPDPIRAIVAWFEQEVLGSDLNSAAHAGRPVHLFFDEVQNVDAWAPQLKALVDHATVHVVVTGSSALRIERGKDSLAGRISTLDAGVLSLTEIARIRGLTVTDPLLPDNGLEPLLDRAWWRELGDRDLADDGALAAAFGAFSERGGYPLAHERADVPWPVVAEQLKETVVDRVIQHDLRLGAKGRKRDRQLLEEVFRLACEAAGETPSLARWAERIRVTLQGNVGVRRVQHYLEFLRDSLLLRVVEPMEIRLKRRRAPSKLCLADHALRAAWLGEVVPLAGDALDRDPHLSDLAGFLAESVVGAALCSVPGLDVTHLPARDGAPEVDFVLTVGTRRVPVEVKYRRQADARRHGQGIVAFIEQPLHNATFGVLVTRDRPPPSPDPRIVAVSLPALLRMR